MSTAGGSLPAEVISPDPTRGLSSRDIGLFGANIPCWIAGPGRAPTDWKKGLVGLRRPATPDFELWNLSLETISSSRAPTSLELSTLHSIHPMSLAAQPARCGGCWGAATPPLFGFEVRFQQAYRGVVSLRIAAVPGDVTGHDRVRLVHSWICQALEGQELAYQIHSSMDGWTLGVSIGWPEVRPQATLEHRAETDYSVRFVSASGIQERAQFAGTECPVCLEFWGNLPPDANVVALPCGHACCAQCLDKATAASLWGVVSCPVCRAPPPKSIFPACVS